MKTDVLKILGKIIPTAIFVLLYNRQNEMRAV